MEKGCERATERPRPPRGGAWKRAATPRESGHPEGRAQGTPSPAQACEYELHGQRPRQAPHRSTPPHSLHSRRCCSTRHAFAKSQQICALLAAACATRRVAHRLHHQSPTLQSLRPLSWYKKVNPRTCHELERRHTSSVSAAPVTSEMYRVSALLACLASASAFAPAAFLPRTGTRGRFCSTSGGTFVSARSPRIVAPGSRRLCCDAFCVASSRCQGRWPPHADERGDPFP